MRIQHGEIILPTRRPPSKKSKKAAAARAGSVDSMDGGADDDSTFGGGGEDDDEGLGGEQWSEEELRAFNEHPQKSKGFVAYVLLRAKWASAMGEQEGMAGEMEVLGGREAELKAECEELIKKVMMKECAVYVVLCCSLPCRLRADPVSSHPSSPPLLSSPAPPCSAFANLRHVNSPSTDDTERSQLDKYLNDYSHQPLKMPVGWTGEGK